MPQHKYKSIDPHFNEGFITSTFLTRITIKPKPSIDVIINIKLQVHQDLVLDSLRMFTSLTKLTTLFKAKLKWWELGEHEIFKSSLLLNKLSSCRIHFSFKYTLKSLLLVFSYLSLSSCVLPCRHYTLLHLINIFFCQQQLPYSREQKHVLSSDMSRFVTPPET